MRDYDAKQSAAGGLEVDWPAQRRKGKGKESNLPNTHTPTSRRVLAVRAMAGDGRQWTEEQK